MRTVILTIMAFLLMLPVGASVRDIQAAADSAYKAEKYNDAVALYEQLADTAGVSADLLYNLANASVGAHEYGKAVLYYERALRLDPSDEDIRSNLAYVSTKVEDSNRSELKGKRLKVTIDEPSFFQSVYDSVACDKSSDTWAVLAACAFILTIGTIAMYIFSSNVLARKVGFFGALVCIAATIVFVIFAFSSQRHFYSTEEGVLMAYKTELLTEPSDKSAPACPALTRGTKLRVVATETDAEGEVTWYRVRLNSDFIGWVRASDLEII